MTPQEKAQWLIRNPEALGRAVGYVDFTDLHGQWITEMLSSRKDMTLQAHRGSFKTSCLELVIALLMIRERDKNIIFLRKTDSDVAAVVKNVGRILNTPVFRQMFNALTAADLEITKSTTTELITNVYSAPRGAPQLQGIGIGGSLTGKHADILITDDIVNKKDRESRAERDRTKSIYQELQNIKNRGGRIINTGTPWHADDCFTLMPAAKKYDCYTTGLISKEQIEELRSSMTASLFACNYELRIIAAEDVIFESPQTGFELHQVEQGTSHVDAAYGGEDWTAFTVCRKFEGKYYVLGKCWRKHVDDVLDKIVDLHNSLNCGIIYCEDNGDKGYLAKAMRAKGLRAVAYHEKQNKFAKITSYLKSEWKNVCFVAGTDEEYINQICDYNENAEHDDCPDSLASLIRKFWGRQGSGESDYKPIFM